MITKIENAKLIIGDEIKEGSNLYFTDGRITEITDKNLNADKIIDARGFYAAPGFIDIHVHGGGGYEFIDSTREALIKAANTHALHGTTTILPTLSAFDKESTKKALDVIYEHRNDKDIFPYIYGVHLEGPYFSKEQCGAQDTAYIRNPDKNEYEELVAEYGDIIKRWSYAPELFGADDFLSFLTKNGIVPSAGHTNAEYCDMVKAYDNGCRLITHFYSCMSTIKRVGGFRHAGVIESGYLFDEVYLEAIADGCHIPPELLKLIYKLKGSDYMCLVTDSIRFGGMSDSDNAEGGTERIPYIIEDGVAKLLDRSAFAGSIATMDILVKNCVQKANIPMTRAVKMASETPAKIMNIKNKGTLAAGYDADVVIFDEEIGIKTVIVNGKIIKEF